MNRKNLLALAIVLTPAAVFAADTRPFTKEFPIGKCEFETTQFEAEEANPFFILKPGRETRYDNAQCVAKGDCEELEELTITVLHQTRNVTFNVDGKSRTVTTRVVRERETANGELVEISHNFYAQCDDAGDVYYFGEDVDIYEDGKVVSHDGAWLAGKNGAKPGIIFPGGAFLIASRYFQEVAPGIALDRAEHVAENLKIQVPAGTFQKCVKIRETTPLEPGSESIKFYCPDVGLVADGDLKLKFVQP